MLYEQEVQETIANCKESGDPNSIRAIFDEALPCGDDVKLYYLAIFVREMFVMNLCKDNTAIPEKFGANRVVFPNGSAKKTPTPNTANHNPSVPITSMLGMVTLPRVSDLLDTNDNASKGSGSDIPSHSSASSQDELPNEDPLVTEQLWQAALSRDREANLFSTHKDFFDALVKDIGTGRGSSMDWADMVDGLQMGEEGVHDYHDYTKDNDPGEDEDSDEPADEPTIQTAAITTTMMQTPAKATSAAEEEEVAAWDLLHSPMETLFRRGYGGLGQTDLKDVIDLLGDRCDEDDEEEGEALQEEEEGVYVGIDDLPVIAENIDFSATQAAAAAAVAAVVTSKPASNTTAAAATSNGKRAKKKAVAASSSLSKSKQQPLQQASAAAAGGGPVVVIPLASTTATATSTSTSNRKSASLDDSLPLELLSPAPAAKAINSSKSMAKSNNNDSKKKLTSNSKAKSITTAAAPIANTMTAEAAESILNDHGHNQIDDTDNEEDIIDLIMTTSSNNKAQEEAADIHHRLGIVQRLKGQANAILDHLNLNSTSQDDAAQAKALTGSESLNAMLKQSFEAHVKAYTQPPPSSQSPSKQSPPKQPAVIYDYAQDATVSANDDDKEDGEIEDDDRSYDTQAYHALMQQALQQTTQLEEVDDIKPAVIKVNVVAKSNNHAKSNSSSRRSSDLGPGNKPVRLKDSTTPPTTTTSAKQAAAPVVRRPSGSRPRGAIIQQAAAPVLKESIEPVIPAAVTIGSNKDARRGSIDSSKRLKDLATPKDIRRRSSTNLTSDPVVESIKLARVASFTTGTKNSRPPSVSASLKATMSRGGDRPPTATAAGITTGVLAGRARSAPRKSIDA